MRLVKLGLFSIAALSLVACSVESRTSSPASSNDALSVSGEEAQLAKTAKSLMLYWYEKGTIGNMATVRDSLSRADGDGTDSDGKAGFHVYRLTNEDDGMPTIA